MTRGFLNSICVGAGLCIALSAVTLAQRRGRAGGAGPSGRGRSSATDGGLKHEVKDAVKKHAVCNDGSPAAFYFRPGQDPDRNKWIVFLQGGGACGTDSDCRKRWQDGANLMSSSTLPMRHEQSGLLSDDERDNRDFARYALATIHYCSSDGWAGDGERRLDGRTLQFRGRRILDAVLDDLEDRSVVGASTLRQATEVIVAGTSAGAIGVHNNLDRLAARMAWARVKGIADSGWPADIAPLGPGTLQVRPDGAALIDYANAQPDESCVAANPSQKGRCLLEPFVFRYLTTPLFVYADQRDPVHLGTYGIIGRATRTTEAYVDRYSATLRTELEQVPAVFSPSINQHTALATQRFHSVEIDDHDLAETIGNWYFGRQGAVHLIAPPTGGATTRGGAVGGRGRGGR